jgi:energy-coupling factor transport system permease protein
VACFFYSISSLILATIDIYGLPLLLFPWFAILLAAAGCSGIGRQFFQAIKKAGFVSLLIFLVQTFIVPGGIILFQFGFLRIHYLGLKTGINLAMSIMTIAGAFVWLFQTTETKEITRALEDAGLHYKACYVFMATMQMIDLLGRNSKTIINAQKARGIETEGNVFIRAKAFVPSMIPLVLGAIISSEERVLTLESKGFDVPCTKTHILQVERSGREKLAMVIALIVFGGVIAGRIIVWTM